MRWSVVDRKATPHVRADLLAKCVGQGLAAMNVEIVHHQVGKLKGGAVRRGESKVAVRRGLHSHEYIRGSSPLVRGQNIFHIGDVLIIQFRYAPHLFLRHGLRSW